MNTRRVGIAYLLFILCAFSAEIVIAFTSIGIQASSGPKFNGRRNVNHRHRFEIKPQFSLLNRPRALKSVMSNVGVISVASTFGLMSDKLRLFSGDAGPVLSLIVSALLSNALSITPNDLVVDICWKLLPASLAFLLISPSSQHKENNDASMHSSAKETITAMSIPFILGSLGSIIGCIISAIVLKGGSNNTNLFQMKSRNHAIIAAGCLVSSYIGGSVNFFATANIIESRKEKLFQSGYASDTSDLFTAMATADLLVMAVYFAFLFSVSNFKPLQRAFPGRCSIDTDDFSSVGLNEPSSASNVTTDRPSGINCSLIISTIISSVFVCNIVGVSDMFENITSRFIPGTGCAAVACLSALFSSALNGVSNRKNNIFLSNAAVRFQNDLTRIGPFISNLFFMLLFASIGLNANLHRALQHGASSLAFAFIALVVHIVVILGFSWVFSVGFPKTRFASRYTPLSLPEVLVASNANIGGASTAAAFASKISKTRSLILGATFWGVIGYATATSIGLFLVRILLHFL